LLLSLAEELAAIHAGQDAVPPLSLDLVWVTSRGTALLLDFPPPTAPPAAPRRDEPPGSIPDEEELQRFLSAVAGLLLFGSHGAPPDETEIMSRFPIAPPCSAIRIWRDSSKGSFASLPALVESLKAVQHGESRIRPLRRFFQFLPLLVLLLAMDFSSIITNSVRGRAEYEHSVLVKAYRAAGALTTTANDPSPAMAVEERRALEILLSGPWREALRDTSSMLPQDGRGRARATLRTWTRIAASNAVPSPDSLAWAEARIRSSRRADILADPPRITVLGMVKFGIENAYAILAIFIIPFFLLFGLLWRGGLGLLLFNQVLVDRRGRLASRRRAFGRTLITCSPFLVHWVYIAAGRGSGPTPVLLIGFAVFLGGVVWALLRPSRSLQDRLAGTWIVPR
jgi:hypothetical protein